MLHDLARSAAAGGLPFDAAAVPETVTLAANRRRLRLTFASGEQEIGAEQLRAACRCAWCTRARIDGTFPATFAGVAIERLDPVGDYAINVAFSDGHARGIYPWPYLRAIANGRTPAHDGQPA
jgi:prepilin-type processing-associated H-X9-DG protein